MAESDLFRLDGRRALITGAGGGIGRALVEAFTAAGCAVVAADRDPALMAPLVCEHRILFELADRAAIRAAVAELEAASLMPDILISNAGFSRAETLADTNDDSWAAEMQINLTGAYQLAHPLVENMARRGGGSVVFISSVNALAHFGNPAYSAAKAGLVALARAIAVERGVAGVRANIVCPGSVRTGAWERRLKHSPDLLDKVAPHYPLGRLVNPAEVARAALFLASEAASGITGVALPVDAGLTAGNLRFVREVLGG
jgi:NAD(P)-dependent dehydrogenase (short-subunit alcohol dehydrogenase family)